MTKAQEALQQAEATWKSLSEVWSARLRALREEAAKDCNHPVEFQRDYTWTHSNGYGSHSRITGLRCSCCGFLKHFTSSSRWSDPKDCTDYWGDS